MRSKLEYLQQKKLNPADDLRETLSNLEVVQPRIKRLDPATALEILHNMDKALQLLTQLEAEGTRVKSERGRFEAVQGHARENVRPLLKAIGGATALAEARPRPAPPPDSHWWWYIHEHVANLQRRLLRRLLLGIITLMTLVVGTNIAFQTVLAPDPAAVARIEAESDAFLAFDEQDLPGALAAVERGLQIVPGDAGILLLQGVFLELSDRPDEAEAAFAQAQVAMDDMKAFHLGRGQVYFRTNQFEKAEAAARAALEVDENIAAAWLLLGQALENQSRRLLAAQAYERAGELALDTGQNEIVVLARLGLGRVSGLQ
jgi:tetratricopeptide (TPR) repeat protein